MVLLSGGIDSAACTRYMQERGLQASCLFVDYGQAAVAHEMQSSATLAKLLGAEYSAVRAIFPNAFGSGEVVGRNAFLALAGLMVSQINTGSIALGIHAGTRYYDCTPGFLTSLDRLLAEYTDGRVRAAAPFISWSKRRIFEYYVGTGLPIEVTYSCEAGTQPPCGACASCLDRKALGCNL